MNNTHPGNLYGLIGYPVKHSLSPAMHNAAFKAAGISAEYRLFEITPEELEDFLFNPDKRVQDSEGNTHRAGDICGFNITIPHKVKAKEILIRHDYQAPSDYQQQDMMQCDVSGAINTVRRDPQGFSCFNTDVWGFMKSLEQDLQFSHAGQSVLLIGCGGAGRAVIAGLSSGPTPAEKIYIYDMSHAAVASAKKHFSRFRPVQQICKFINYDEIKEIIVRCRLLVNASPLGMHEEDAFPVAPVLLHKDLSVYDVIYTRQTSLVRYAKDKGLAAVDGRGMLAYQGARAWALWMHEPEPCQLMREVLERELS